MEITHDQLPRELSRMGKDGFPPVFLLFGEDVFVARAFSALADALVPEELRSLNLEVFGPEAGAGTVAEALFTFPMFPADKLVAWKDTRALTSGKQAGPILQKALDHFAADEKKKAADLFLSAMGLLGLSWEDVDPADPAAGFGGAAPEQIEGLKDLFDHCRGLGESPKSLAGDAEILLSALRQGFPPGNRLLMTAPAVDKKSPAYAFIKENGLVVDAGLPEGNRAADAKVREEAARSYVRSVLDPLGKSMAPDALALLIARTGTDMRGLSTQAEKLALAVGDRKRIEASDVETSVSRTRSDPAFLFTDAVADRNAPQALSLLFRLLDDGAEPLYLAAALAGRLRSLAAGRAFLTSPQGNLYSPGMSFSRFQERVWPALAAHEEEAAARLASDAPAREAAGKAEGKKKKKKQASASDLLLSGKSRPPYVAFLTLKKAARFSAAELGDGMLSLHELDRTLKSSPADPRTLLTGLVLSLCCGGGSPGPGGGRI